MSSRVWFALILAGLALAIPAAAPRVAPLVAQSGLAQLGLTEVQARTFLLEEMKSQTPGGRRTSIAVAGHRAFYKLPPAARGPAASALFAWAKAYVNSPAFKTTYAQFRRDAHPLDDRAPAASSQAASAELAEMLAGLEEIRKAAATMPPAERDQLLAQLKAQEAQLRDPRFAERMQQGDEARRAEAAASNAASVQEFEELFPPDPNRIVARRLRRFLGDTADADFSARIIRLTDGPDGMEFIAPAHRAKSPTWQLAVLAGADATRAARVAAEAWLKEIEP